MDYYTKGKDTIGYNAACFLIKNMPGKYAIIPEDYSYMDILKKRIGSDDYNGKIEFCKTKVCKVFDIDVITSEYLIISVR